ncbi:Holliday junction resolvase RecU [Serpentinicella sp. ANB-PHB4]|uniref:Holliday junction resolvase RecU n=1 Tax=Serpentinicella sp. ANB-PHB4 TaxID=3074076 RepID=UPI0028600F38|nr:Holliday junction resolvase RecU [Serpentinicella sp. ANB-PHB4]MDR5659504.1 Holliday junction resolvase RecU [Serpentinicella sp. ANB-PHB4]
MTAWRTLGHRGDALELLLETTHEFYKRQGLGLVDKIHTPIKVTEIDKGIITKAFFDKKSTVDFMGLIQGIGVAFDAKETQNKSIPLKNIHDHQIEFMKAFEEQKGLAFLIVHYKKVDSFYLIPIHIILDIITNGKKSISYTVLPEEFKIQYKNNGLLDYLPTLNTYLDWKRDQQKRKCTG